MTSEVEVDFLRRLSNFEDRLTEHLLHSSTFSTLTKEWLQLVDELQPAIDSDTLSISTISLVQTISEKISGIISDLSEVQQAEEQLSIEVDRHDGVLTTQPSERQAEKPRVPGYVPPAYQWLLKNIHNPYPSSSTRDEICRSTGCSRRDIDNWFISARKRIGWTALRKKSFKNKRVDIVGAARRFFLPENETLPLDPIIEAEFAAIEGRVKDLWAGNLSKSSGATQLAKQTPPYKTVINVELAYPSPAPSPGPLENSNTTIAEKYNITEISCKKRRHSATEASITVTAARPAKRIRRQQTDKNSLPSPTREVTQHLPCVQTQPSSPITPSSSLEDITGPLPASLIEIGPPAVSPLTDLPELSFSDVSFSSIESLDCAPLDDWFQLDSQSSSPHFVDIAAPSSGVNVEVGQIFNQLDESGWMLLNTHDTYSNGYQALDIPDLELPPAKETSFTPDCITNAASEGLTAASWDTDSGQSALIGISGPNVEPEPIPSLPPPNFYLADWAIASAAKPVEDAKAEKVKQLREMREAMFRLEQEIALFG